MNHNTQL